MSQPIVNVSKFTKKFKNITAVNNVSMEIEKGEVFGLLGTNGAGKTTLIRAMCGLLNPTSGSIELFGKNVQDHTMEIRRRLALLPQECMPYEELTAWENILYYGQMHDGLSDEVLKERTGELIDLIGLRGRENDTTKKYSGGMKRKVLVARALITDPELIFLDEPTTGIDILGARTVRNLIQKLSRDEKKTIILTTHDLTDVNLLCDRVGIMVNGDLVAIGTPDDLEQQFRANNLEDLFTSLATGEGLEKHEEVS